MATIKGNKTASAEIGVNRTYTSEGVPVDGASGTYAGAAPKGAVLTDTVNANLYINAGTLDTPVWKLVTRAA